MSNRDYRPGAHMALRELWEVCDTQLREAGNIETLPNGTVVREYVTPSGAEICRIDDTLSVSGDFVRHLGGGTVEETVTITFPEDIRDLADSNISVEWANQRKSGTNTIGVRHYREYASLMMGIVRPESVNA